jgi:hypothetical protein
LLVGGTSTHAANPSMLKSIQYDPIADFVPISQFGLFPYFLIVDPGLPVKSVADLVTLASTWRQSSDGSVPGRLRGELLAGHREDHRAFFKVTMIDTPMPLDFFVWALGAMTVILCEG